MGIIGNMRELAKGIYEHPSHVVGVHGIDLSNRVRFRHARDRDIGFYWLWLRRFLAGDALAGNSK